MNTALGNSTEKAQDEFSTELFNVSKEFEDIDFVINQFSGELEMDAVSRRC